VFRYVAVTWDARSETQSAAVRAIDARMRADSPDWSVIAQHHGLVVYCAGVRAGSSEVYPLADRSGVVLGTVFRHHTTEKAKFGAAATAKVLATRGRSLVDEHWGRYVAFVWCSQDSSTFVVRSPSGELDCLSTQIQGVRIHFSSARHCPLLEMRSFSINWEHVCADLATLMPDTRATGLMEVERLMRGECLHVQRDRTERLQFWNPIWFVQQDPIEDVQVAARELHATASTSVNAWASCYNSVIAMLSGGLDSSIIVGLLRDAPTQPAVACLNYRNKYDVISDERRYARLVAERAGYPLVEHEQPEVFSLAPILQLPRAVSPWLTVYEIGDVEHRRNLSREYEAQAWFLGHGGDQIFFKGAGEYSCADFIHRYGFRPGVFAVALHAARMTRRSLWKSLVEGMRDGTAADSLTPMLRNYEMSSLLSEEVLAGIRQGRMIVPHWFEGNQRIPPGKCWQLTSLSMTDAMHSLYASDEQDPETVNPLLAQPLQELCLRIPTHVLAHGGKDRGLARIAFAPELPPAIVRRHTKGGIQEYVKAIWIANQSLVRSLLLDGVLVRQGVVDRPKIERALARNMDTDLGNIGAISGLVCAEAWARTWQPSSQRKVA
jgi:asparagine synthase (glutamine-hydrolysing)